MFLVSAAGCLHYFFLIRLDDLGEREKERERKRWKYSVRYLHPFFFLNILINCCSVVGPRREGLYTKAFPALQKRGF